MFQSRLIAKRIFRRREIVAANGNAYIAGTKAFGGRESAHEEVMGSRL